MLVLACGSAPRAVPAKNAVTSPHAATPAASPEHTKPAPAATTTPLTPCQRVEEHNLALLREASARVAGIIDGMSGSPLKTRVEAAEQWAKTKGQVTTPAGARLDSLNEQQLRTLAPHSYDAQAYETAREQLATLTALAYRTSGTRSPTARTRSTTRRRARICSSSARGHPSRSTTDKPSGAPRLGA